MFLLWPTLLLIFYGLCYYFSTVLWATSARVYCNTTFTHSCLLLASPLARTFVCLCLRANELFSHAYEHSYVHTHNANEPFVPLTRVGKTASRASATKGEANDTTNDEANMWLVHSLFALLFASPLTQMCKCSIARVCVCMHNASKLVFKFLKIICRYAKWSRIWNMFLFLVVW